MTGPEFSDQFDVLFNNITSNQAPGLNEYEKSVFLTKAQNEIVKNYFTANSKGNNTGQGFDDSAKRQADFSCLMKTKNCEHSNIGGSITSILRTYICIQDESRFVLDSSSLSFSKDGLSYDVPIGGYEVQVINNEQTISVMHGEGHSATTDIVTVTGFPFEGGGYLTVEEVTHTEEVGKIDYRSEVFRFPSDVFIVINETIKNDKGKYLQVVPLRYDTYTALMSKPYKRPNKNQAWRLINQGNYDGNGTNKYVEVVLGPNDVVSSYNIRYIRSPKPIIIGSLDGLTIDGYEFGTGTNKTQGCELDPILHEEILQRAVELAKIAWAGEPAATVQAGQRSE